MKEPVYKHWQEWLAEDGFVSVEAQEGQLGILASYNSKYDDTLPQQYKVDSAVNYILVPNVEIIKEYNTTFVELMKNHSHKYKTKRIVPIQIIRCLIDICTAFKAYLRSSNKKRFLEKYHRGNDIKQIDGHTTKFYVRELQVDYPFLLELYEECCRYIHPGYHNRKSNSTFDYTIKPGRLGFMQDFYKVKEEDFENEIREGFISYSDIPFNYEEENDIVSFCIKVNDMLIETMNEVIKVELQ